ncbi:MAG TPA: threonine synthase [Gaiellales bacterium]|jgi:threonine synthase|nr:threonine synthase [Gaiellales bacterium]
MYATHLVCKGCGSQHPLEARFACDRCFGPLEAAYDRDAIAAGVTRELIESGPSTLWRWESFLPVDAPVRGLPVGNSPLLRADRLAAELGLDCELYVKTETSNPTHSFKDRVVAVAAAKSVELGYEALACASTGNLAGATAAAGAALGLPTYIFVPSDLEPEKIIAAAAYGATVFVVDGTYDDVNRLCSELAYDRPWAFVNVNMRAYYAEGSKTIALETAEQLGWRVPDRVIAPIASGSLYTKILQGFEEGRAAGLLDDGPDPVMHGCQGAGCAPVATAFAGGADHVVPVKPTGIAKSLAIGSPADGVYALDVARRTGGSIEAVDDGQIVEGISLLAAATGVFTETAGGVTTGVLRKLAERGEIGAGETVVAYITGDGLKTIDAVRPAVRTIAVLPDPDDVDAALERRLASA